MPDPFDRLNAALSGRYQLVRILGEGGMATVYLAEDVRHDRKVALKALKPDVAAAVGSERFLAEIRTTANLQHPHILPLFDSGEADGFVFFVMPYVEGESLRDRLDREKQLPVADAVRIASEIADALEHAHRHGVIHRDIKPGNILLAEDHVQVADFGIALAVQQAGGSRLTETGLSIGTARYMSPEQSSGDRELDGRTDVYALGVVLFEMLAGEPPHTGATAQSILARILTEPAPAVGDLRPTVPSHVEAAVAVALERLPADRFASVSDFRAALRGETAVPAGRVARAASTPRSTRGFGRGVPWAVASGAIALAVAAWAGAGDREPERVRHLNVALPDSAPLVFIGEAGPPGETALALSPDGRHLAYVAPADTTTRIVLRDLESGRDRVLPGTAGAFTPFFSPDGGWIGFFAGRELKRVSLDGERVLPMARVDVTRGAAWGPDDRILVAFEDGLSLGLVSPSAGGLTPLETHGWGGRFTHPLWLPDGEWLVLHCRAPTHLCAVSSRSGEVRHLTLDGPAVSGEGQARNWLAGMNPRFIAPDLLVYTTRNENVVMGVRFDPDRLEVLSPPVPLLSGIRREDVESALQLAVSSTGDAVFARGVNRGTGRFAWVDAEGRVEVLPFAPRTYGAFRLSSDGRFVATMVTPGTGDAELWFLDLRRPGEERQWTPSSVGAGRTGVPGPWDPTTRSFFISHTADGIRHILRVDPLRVGGEEVVWSHSTSLRIVDRVDDDRVLVGFNDGVGPEEAIGILDLSTLANAAPDRLPDVEAIGYGYGPLSSVSPDGEWLTYSSSATGPVEVFAHRVGSATSPFAVSGSEGQLPRWTPDGRGFWYRAGRRFYWVARTGQADDPFAPPAPGPLGDFLQVGGPETEVSPDGRLLVLLGIGDETTTQLEIVVNWDAEAATLLDEAGG